MSATRERKTAAFYDLDGTILHGSVVDHYVYFARTDPRLNERVRRLLTVLAKAPYYRYVDSLDRRRFNEEFYRSYAGLSEDRLPMLGEALFETIVFSAVLAPALCRARITASFTSWLCVLE